MILDICTRVRVASEPRQAFRVGYVIHVIPNDPVVERLHAAVGELSLRRCGTETHDIACHGAIIALTVVFHVHVVPQLVREGEAANAAGRRLRAAVQRSGKNSLHIPARAAVPVTQRRKEKPVKSTW